MIRGSQSGEQFSSISQTQMTPTENAGSLFFLTLVFSAPFYQQWFIAGRDTVDGMKESFMTLEYASNKAIVLVDLFGMAIEMAIFVAAPLMVAILAYDVGMACASRMLSGS